MTIKTIIKFAVGLLTLVAFLGLVINLFNSGKGVAEKQAGEISSVLSVGSSKYESYDGTIVSGTELTALIKGLQNDVEGVKIEVKTKAASAYVTYPTATLEADRTADNYINPNGKFKGKIKKSTNGILTAVSFEQQ